MLKKVFFLCLKRFRDEYFTKEHIILNDSCDFDVFCHFIGFLISRHTPSDRNDQIGVINLLREWESHFGILDTFRFGCQEKDAIVVYNGEEHEVIIGCLLFHCVVFQRWPISPNLKRLIVTMHIRSVFRYFLMVYLRNLVGIWLILVILM